MVEDNTGQPKRQRRTVRCPECKSTQTVLIWYGGIYPDEEEDPHTYKKIQSGDFYHAGLELDENGEAVPGTAIRHCNNCNCNY